MESKRRGEMSDQSDSEIAHDVLRSIRQIMRKVSEHSKSLSAEVGLTVPQLMCLKAIGEMEEEGKKEITVASVAQRVQLSPATVSRVIDKLVRVELLHRNRGEKDRRKVCLSLTIHGLERFQTLPVPLQEAFVERLQSLPRDERLALLEALRRLSTLMEAESLQVAPILHEGEVMKGETPELERIS